jgi:predicted glutamine amidotransferase
MFMHNGQIGDWSLIRRRVEELIPDEFYRSRAGTTDSEAMFLAILGAGADTDPIAATMRTLTTLTELVSTSGTTEPLRFTAALADGRVCSPSATLMAARRIRCTTARPGTASSWCRSRSTWSASSGSRSRPAI